MISDGTFFYEYEIGKESLMSVEGVVGSVRVQG